MTLETFRQVIEHAQAQPYSPELILLTGDLVQDDTPEAYEHFGPLLEPFQVPVLCLPGNHDLRDIMRERFVRAPFTFCEVRDLPHWRIICLDSCVPGSAGGRVSEDELGRLTAALESSPKEHVLVCLHHPPVLTGSAWLDTVGLDDREAFMDLLASFDSVRMVLAGHVHQDIDTTVESGSQSIRVVTSPSTCRQFKPRSRQFAVDDLPPAYRRLELQPNGDVDCELVWVDD